MHHHCQEYSVPCWALSILIRLGFSCCGPCGFCLTRGSLEVLLPQIVPATMHIGFFLWPLSIMMVSDEFRCRLQLVNVVDVFFGGRAIGQKLSYWPVDDDGVKKSQPLLDISFGRSLRLEFNVKIFICTFIFLCLTFAKISRGKMQMIRNVIELNEILIQSYSCV